MKKKARILKKRDRLTARRRKKLMRMIRQRLKSGKTLKDIYEGK
jgi:hypothetical protein